MMTTIKYINHWSPLAHKNYTSYLKFIYVREDKLQSYHTLQVITNDYHKQYLSNQF